MFITIFCEKVRIKSRSRKDLEAGRRRIYHSILKPPPIAYSLNLLITQILRTRTTQTSPKRLERDKTDCRKSLKFLVLFSSA